ncbi:hypothetical protein ABID22_000901 [Pontibacter aydingkolensis]|uniref:Outer membrane protein beta-barrel domain-containing protein n=1 Tax=Pontibacter aydingkolensis TaxID=1911536 RepID=A0ABS7CSN1_9BACT|nr:hypothetical protein [Pontibacter aydingkolensis]MBW7466847.1 hypothetical protein [Pontibacter aydingkolensis]
MRTALLTVIFMLFNLELHAQIISYDLLHTKDKQVIKGKVVEVSDSLVTFRKHENLDGPVYTLRSSNLIRIEYSNGYVEHYAVESDNVLAKREKRKNNSLEKANATVGSKLKEESLTGSDHKTEAKIDEETATGIKEQKVKSAKEEKAKFYYKLNVGLVADFSNMLTGVFEEKESVDFGKGQGGLVRVQYNVLNNFGIRFGAGYSQWVKEDSTNSTKPAESILKTVPILVGAKYYLGNNFFLAGDVGIVMHKTSFKNYYDESRDDVWMEVTSEYNISPSASLSIGGEVQIMKLVIDVAPYFQWFGTKEYEFGMYYAGVRLGTSLGLGKKHLKETL